MRNGRTTMPVVGLLSLAGPAAAKKCGPDAVQPQTVCIDKYEASVWETDPKTVRNIRKGKIKNIGGLVLASHQPRMADRSWCGHLVLDSRYIE